MVVALKLVVDVHQKVIPTTSPSSGNCVLFHRHNASLSKYHQISPPNKKEKFGEWNVSFDTDILLF